MLTSKQHTKPTWLHQPQNREPTSLGLPQLVVYSCPSAKRGL